MSNRVPQQFAVFSEESLGKSWGQGHMNGLNCEELRFESYRLNGLWCTWLHLLGLYWSAKILGQKHQHPWLSHPSHFVKMSYGNENRLSTLPTLVLKNCVPFFGGDGDLASFGRGCLCLGPEWSSPDRFFNHRSFPLSARIETRPPISPRVQLT